MWYDTRMPDLQELELNLEQASTQTEHIDALNALANFVFESDWERSHDLSDQAYQLSSQGEFAEAPYKKGLAQSGHNLARYNLQSGKYDLALAQALESLALAEEIDYQPVLTASLFTLAVCYRRLGDLSSAVECYFRLRSIWEETGERSEMARTLVGLGAIFGDLEDYHSAILYSEQSLTLLQRPQDDRRIATVLNNLCYTYYKLGRFDEALERGLASLKMAQELDFLRTQIVVTNSLAEVTLEMGEVQQALGYLSTISGLQAREQHLDLQAESLYLLGQVYMRQGESQDALDALRRALALAENIHYKRFIYDCHRLLADVYKDLGDFASALAHYQQFHLIKESVFSEENARKIHNLEVLRRTQAAQREADAYARLYEQTRQFNEQLEAEVRARTDDLRQAYDQLERLDRAKTDFIQVTAHELRTPLTVLKGYTQLLQENQSMVGVQEVLPLLTGIITGSERMNEIVNTMLLMVKIDSRALDIYPEPISIVEVLINISASLEAAVAKREQSLVIDPNIHDLPSLEADQAAITTVFEKLIENAIKYTPNGGSIRLSGCSWQEPPRPDLPAQAIEIILQDTGIGIAPESLELIFTKFYRTGSAALHSTGKTKFKGGGTGLGLAIARGIIEAHHGKLWAESDGLDEKACPGSRFHVVLPLVQERTTPTA